MLVAAPESTLFVLIPVHNRCAVTHRCLEQLRVQAPCNLAVVVVDDGSSDGTGEMLRSFTGLRIEVVEGDGSLWWGGAVAVGMHHIDRRAGEADRVLLLNDDVDLPPDFLARMLAAADAEPGAMLGCVQRDLDGRHQGYRGYAIDYRRQVISLVPAADSAPGFFDTSALAGRGLLFGVSMMRAIGYVDTERFPHYWGDIEYTARAKDFGYRVACIDDLSVWTSFRPSDGSLLSGGWRKRYFSPVSSHNVLQRYRFWMRRGPRWLRLTAVFRYPVLQVARLIHRVFDADRKRARS